MKTAPTLRRRRGPSQGTWSSGRLEFMSVSVQRRVVLVITGAIFTVVVAIAVGDIAKPSSETKMTAMGGEMKVHSDTPIGVFSFAAMEKTFNDHILNASTVKFDPILKDPLHLELLANDKIYPYGPRTTHRCIVRNNSFVYGWCEELQINNGTWMSTHIVIYQPVMAGEQVIAAAAAKTILNSTVVAWVMAEVTSDTQESYAAGHMSLGHVSVPGLAGLATRIACDEDSADRMCGEEIPQAARVVGINSHIFEQVFAVRSTQTDITVMFIPQADTEDYSAGTVHRFMFKVLLTPSLSLSPSSCLKAPIEGDCYVVSFRRSSQKNDVDVGHWRLAYWIQVTFFIAIVHLLTIGQTLGPVQRFIIILRLPIFNILAAQTLVLAAQELKVLMILRYESGWRNDLVHRMLVLLYAYVVVCCHAILSSREDSVPKAQFWMLGATVLSSGVVIGVTRWLSLPTTTPNLIQSCYYCEAFNYCSSTNSMCCTLSYWYWELGVVVVIYLCWITVAVTAGVMRNKWSTKSFRRLIVPSGAQQEGKLLFRNIFERECLNDEIIAEYRAHNVYREIGAQCATTDLGLALTGYCATRDHIIRIDTITFSGLALLLPKWIVLRIPVTVTAWPLQRFDITDFTTSSPHVTSDQVDSSASKRKAADATGGSEIVHPMDPIDAGIEPMMVTSARRVHIRNVILQWGRVERVYL